MAEQRPGGGTAVQALAEPHVRLSLEMGLLLLGAWLTSGLAMPWRVAGVVFSVLAAVQGVRALRALRRHRRGHPDLQALGPAGGVLLVLGVVAAVALTLLQVLLLAVWPLVQEQDDCRERALTRVAMERCEERLLERMDELVDMGG